jgi:hypothetical protein
VQTVAIELLRGRQPNEYAQIIVLCKGLRCGKMS